MSRTSSLSAILAILFVASALNIKAQDVSIIESVEARLFNSRTGEFSPDVLGENAPPLGNVIIGEFSSVSTFIKVKLRFPSGTSDRDPTVKLTARENNSMPFSDAVPKQGNKVILDSSARVGALNTDGSAYVGFWLENTGCKAIELTVSVSSSNKQNVKIVTLPFACYE